MFVQGSPVDGNTNRNEDEQDIEPAIGNGILGVFVESFTAFFGPLRPGRLAHRC